MHDLDQKAAKADMALTASTGSSLAQLATDARARKAAIAIRVSAILSQFWTEDSPDELRAVELEGWLDVLDGVSTDELRAAWAEYQRNGPRSESRRLARPDAGAIYLIVTRARRDQRISNPPPRVQLPAPPPEPRMSPERMAEIMQAVGYHGNGIIEPKRFPRMGDGHE